MPRFLRRNVAIHGLNATDTEDTVRWGLRTPAAGIGPQLIIPQCIDWPFSADAYGLAYPSGIVAARSVAYDRATEMAWATPGDPDENRDNWIAVPDTLPVGYTARVGRDVNRGRIGTQQITFPPPYFFPTLTDYPKGAPYIDVAHNDGSLFVPLSSGGMYTIGQRFDVGFEPSGPCYRPTGGGGLVGPLTWYPMNVGNRALRVIADPLGDRPIPSQVTDAAAFGFTMSTAVSQPSFPTWGADWSGDCWWLQPTPGWRRLRVRATFMAISSGPIWSGPQTDLDIQAQVVVRHNADGSAAATQFTSNDPADTLDYVSPLVTLSSFSSVPPATNPASDGFSYAAADIVRSYLFDITDSDVIPPTKAQGMRAYQVRILLKFMSKLGPTGDFAWGYNSTLDSDETHHDYSCGMTAHPRLDVPLWFSAYGAGVAAPGGV